MITGIRAVGEQRVVLRLPLELEVTAGVTLPPAEVVWAAGLVATFRAEHPFDPERIGPWHCVTYRTPGLIAQVHWTATHAIHVVVHRVREAIP